ncbi:hypothetical protein [Chroococcidiopsis sp.]|uniref:hypothetical protein n=1 Tax=Chroococcidiopsis sp. TaxID=3088168 RepID=UPI003F2FDD13
MSEQVGLRLVRGFDTREPLCAIHRLDTRRKSTIIPVYELPDSTASSPESYPFTHLEM